MVTFVVPVSSRAAVGDTLMVERRPAVVVHLLPRVPRRGLAARVTRAPECGRCGGSLTFAPADNSAARWRCAGCQTLYDRTALADLLAEHVADGGARAHDAGRDRERRARQVRRGAPGAAMILHRAAADGGALSRAELFEATTGPERRALRWALRDDGDLPLPPERCREAAAELARLKPGDLPGA